MSSKRSIICIHLFLLSSVLTYLIIISVLSNSRSPFEYWIIVSLFLVAFFQALVSLATPTKFLSYLIGLLITPLLIVSCIMGYFQFYDFHLPPLQSYQKTGSFVFLELNFLIFLITSIFFIRSGLGVKLSNKIT